MKKDEIIIRQFTEDDFDNTRILWNKAGLNISLSDTDQELAKIVTTHSDLCLIGELTNEESNGSQIIATALGGFDGRRGWIYHFAVSPHYQGQHIGKMMMEELIQRFKAKNVIKIMLLVHNDNSRAIHFYEKIGWKIRQDLNVMSFTLRE